MKRPFPRRVLALALVAGLLAGCGKPAASAPAAPPASAAPAPAASTLPPAESTPTPSLPAGVSPLAEYPAARTTIDEEMYVNWVNELNWNCELYLEQSVRIQGMYTSEIPDGLSTALSYVYRVGPGCCGTDGDICGLQILLPAGVTPAEGDWIDVYGTLEIVELDGFKFLALNDTLVTVDNDHRGLENVLHQL